MRELILPAWASKAEDPGKAKLAVQIDSAPAYKEWLRLLDVSEVDQYWLEVAYQCIKLDTQAALVGTEFDPRTSGKHVEFRFSNAPEYALAAHPEGRGVAAATQGKEARGHYTRLRGGLPF